MPQPADLRGLTLIDLAGMGPSARCVRLLADLGARWIRLTPPAKAERWSVPWHSYGAMRGAELIELDLKAPHGRDTFLKLVKRADIVVESSRPGVADRLGIGWRDASAVNPRLIYASLSGYGQDGPYAQWAGHDINYQALGGALCTAGVSERGAPAIPGQTFADSAGGGWHGAMLILAAVIARQSTGMGKFLDVSAAEGMLHMAQLSIDEYFATGEQARAGVSLTNGGYAFYDTYVTADGGAVAVGAIEPKFFRTLCLALELPHFVDRQYDASAQAEMRAAFVAKFNTKTRDEWAKLFGGMDACVTPVLTIGEVTEDPHWKARGMFVDFTHPEQGTKGQLRPIGRGDPAARGAAPVKGDATATRVLGEFGFSADEIAALKADGTIG